MPGHAHWTYKSYMTYMTYKTYTTLYDLQENTRRNGLGAIRYLFLLTKTAILRPSSESAIRVLSRFSLVASFLALITHQLAFR